MSVLDDRERTQYLESPYFKKQEYGDFAPFYITITICTILFFIIIIANIVLGCCSKYSEYWNDRHTGMFLFLLSPVLEFMFLIDSRESVDSIALDGHA